MKKKVEFRGKRVSDNEWIYGYLADESSINNINEIATPNEDIDPETVGQFTNMYDCDGKPIFEGDIVESVSWNEFWSVGGNTMEPMRRRLFVDFRYGGFKLVEHFAYPMSDSVFDLSRWDEQGELKIVGNVYDNPELLKTEFTQAIENYHMNNNESVVS